LINTARGGLIDEAALADLLRSGHLGGAGLDVLSVEPPKDGNPMLNSGLPNVLITPHIAWTSARALAVLAEEVILNVEAFMKGERRHRVA
jgi:glycerate dehydrogenase